jgi:starch phosphorylase
MKPSHTFTIIPSLPPKLEPLRRLAHNLHWSWNHDTIELFRRLDRDLWETSGHNPVRMLGTIRQERLEEVVEDDGYFAQLERLSRELDRYLKSQSTWYHKQGAARDGALLAYFSAEFGITECMPIYSGGLGILAGDHLKSASELGLPFVGVGLLYQQGYFRQYLNVDGWQQEHYPENDFYNLPITLERHVSGAPVVVDVEYPGRTVRAQVWRADVGRVPLYLLDTNIPENQPKDRDITDQLYGGDLDMRIQQEIMLGIGGVRALHALDIYPTVYHMNEGHSAFLGLERIRLLMADHGVSFWEALEAARAGSLFTTHTPVPAGIDWFAPDLVDHYLRSFYLALGLDRKTFLGLGRPNPVNEHDYFCMAILAMRLASHTNGVSQLHGGVSRKMWSYVWPGVPQDEVPIEAVTNGIHTRSWISHDMADLYDRYLGPRWRDRPADLTVWRRVDRVPDEELWRTHERRRERLVAFARRRLRAQLKRRGARPAEIEQASEVLNPSALTIGFARRFATYKRAALILRDVERLIRILSHRDRPVQIIYAGKAHPADNPGKELIRQIIHAARHPDLRNHIVFIEDYDMVVARYLVQGCDVWLNTPVRPHEASGTSGMKASVNGALNLSTLDGWWVEGYSPQTGWAIGSGEVYEDRAYQDQVEAAALYQLLEEDVVPLFYSRGRDGLPRGWIAKMKATMREHGAVFNTNRMVRDYAERFYMPAVEQYATLSADGLERALGLAEWKKDLRKHWGDLRIERVRANGATDLEVGQQLEVTADVYLNQLRPTDVMVEIYWGPLDARDEVVQGKAIPMLVARSKGDGHYVFAGALPCEGSGRYGFALRILPNHADQVSAFETGLIKWGV